MIQLSAHEAGQGPVQKPWGFPLWGRVKPVRKQNLQLKSDACLRAGAVHQSADLQHLYRRMRDGLGGAALQDHLMTVDDVAQPPLDGTDAAGQCSCP